MLANETSWGVAGCSSFDALPLVDRQRADTEQLGYVRLRQPQTCRSERRQTCWAGAFKLSGAPARPPLAGTIPNPVLFRPAGADSRPPCSHEFSSSLRSGALGKYWDAPVNEHDITGLLHAWRGGSNDAAETLMRAVYPVLRDLARARSAQLPAAFTLRATDLVNEAYLRLSGAPIDWKDRSHFFAVAARAIRNTVIDYVRAQNAEKRGGDLPFVPLDLAGDVAGDDLIDLRIDWLAVHAALNELEALDTRAARVVELKFFSGLTTEEIADATGSSRSNVVRDWRFARIWLADRLGASTNG